METSWKTSDIDSGMSEAGYGIGAYTPSEAGKLLGVPPATIRRWLFGYSYARDGIRTAQRPLWQPEYGVDQEDPILGFRDLIEARIVRGLRSMHIGLPTIRECLARAAEIVEDDHPFSTTRFKTDGKRIFLEMTEGIDPDEEPALIDLKARQRVFQKIVAPSFIDLSYEAEAAAQWWLLPKKKTVVLDPKRSFGQPIVHEGGVPTSRLAQAVSAEGSVKRVAELFEVAAQSVRDALQFEKRKAALPA